MKALKTARDTPAGVRLVHDAPLPVPSADEVLIRVRLAGICATDLEIARGYMQFDGILGHEFVGEVVTENSPLAGRRVVGEINGPCGECALCRRGLTNHCPNRSVLGIAGRDGAFAEYLTLPAVNCHLVSQNVADAEAVFVEPLAAAAHVLNAARFGPRTRVALLGAGRLGLLVAQVLATQECELEVIARNPRSLALCRAWGLNTTDVRAIEPAPAYDVVVECTGAPDGLRLALQITRPTGTIVLKSTYAAPEPVDLAPIVINEIRVIGSRCGAFAPALKLLAEGRVDVAPLISATLPLDRAEEAFQAAADPAYIKVLLRPEEA